jgi:hypothetical protein
VRLVGICSGQSGSGLGVLLICRFPLAFLIPPTASHPLVILPSTQNSFNYRIIKIANLKVALVSACFSLNILKYKNGLSKACRGNNIQGGSNMTGTDFFLQKNSIAKHLLARVNTFFPTFWKHPDALFKKGFWLAAYPLPNRSGPNWDCTSDVAEGSISSSGGCPLLF